MATANKVSNHVLTMDSGVDCPVCGRTCKSRPGLGAHFSNQHGVTLIEYERRKRLGEDAVKCPTCDKPFADEPSMTKHHTQSHGVKLTLATRTCDNCGEDFQRQRSELIDSDYNFCSMGCHGKFRSKNGLFSGENNPRWKGGNVTCTCPNCGNEFEREPWEVRTYKRNYCSYECKAAYVAEHHPEELPNWQGGAAPYGKGWNDAKKQAVRERDEHTCQGCGRSQENNVETFGRKLTVHHIQKAREFDDPEKRNAMGNLVSLCDPCHHVWERMSPLRPVT